METEPKKLTAAEKLSKEKSEMTHRKNYTNRLKMQKYTKPWLLTREEVDEEVKRIDNLLGYEYDFTLYEQLKEMIDKFIYIHQVAWIQVENKEDWKHEYALKLCERYKKNYKPTKKDGTPNTINNWAISSVRWYQHNDIKLARKDTKFDQEKFAPDLDFDDPDQLNTSVSDFVSIEDIILQEWATPKQQNILSCSRSEYDFLMSIRNIIEKRPEFTSVDRIVYNSIVKWTKKREQNLEIANHLGISHKYCTIYRKIFFEKIKRYRDII